MAIGRHQPETARVSGLQSAIRIALDEALTALEESVQGLTCEQMWAEPFANRPSIGRRLGHCLENFGGYACMFHTGRNPFEGLLSCDLADLANLDQPFGERPPVEEMMCLLRAVRAVAMPALEAMTDAQLLTAPVHEGAWWDWWRGGGRNRAEAYVRTISHTLGHVRQIWLIRGALGLTDAQGWPEQHYV
jgi:DinB family protein